MLELGLEDGTLIKTGDYRKHPKDSEKEETSFEPVDPDNMELTESDFSLNYNQSIFDLSFSSEQ